MRCNNEFRSLLAKINIEKEKYAQRELFVSYELEQKIQIETEKKKKNDVYIIVAFSLLIVIMGYIYDFLKIVNQKWIITIVIIIMAIIMGIFILKGIIYKVKLNHLSKKKEQEDQEKTSIRSKIKELNDQISALVLSVIVLNEHFYELSLIQSKELREKRWEELIFNQNVAINRLYNYVPTTEDFLNYYKEYEQLHN